MIYKIVDIVFQVLYMTLFIRVVMSWIPHDRYHPIMNVIYNITDPMLKPFENIVPSWKIGIDLSPIFAFIALGLVKRLIFMIL